MLARPLGALLAAAALAMPLPAQRMLVRQPSAPLGYGYGLGSWSAFTGILDGAFGGAPQIDVVSDIAPEALGGYSALLLGVPDLPDAPWLLSASERAAVTAFVSGGGRVFAVGENAFWGGWDDDVASLFGAATAGVTLRVDVATPRAAHPLTAGVSAIYHPAAGSFASLGATGVSLFDTDVAALFGPAQNALVVLDTNVCDDEDIGTMDNRQFCSNVAAWLRARVTPGPVTAAPEPATVGLLAAGLVALGVVGRRGRLARQRH